MEDKKINKWLRHQFSAVGWTLVVYYGMMYFLSTVSTMVEMTKQYLRGYAAGDLSGVPDLNALMENAWPYMLVIALGLLILWAWKGTDYWKTEILHKEAPMRASAFLAMLILMCGAQLISGLWITGVEAVLNLFGRSVMDQIELVIGGSNSVSMLLYMSFLAPLSEEILFRGFVLRSLRPYGKRFAIVLSALLFALFHGNLLQMPFAFLAGLILGYIAVEYSLPWAIGLHVFNNLVGAILADRLLSLLPATVGETVDVVITLAFAAAAVGILVKKRREIRDYRRGDGMDGRCVKCFFTNAGVLIFTIAMVLEAISMLLLSY